MEWTMEWTDGMEYQLTQIAKTHSMAMVKLKVLSHHCSLLHVDEAMFWPCGCQVMCVSVGTSLKFAVPNYGPVFG